jgi:hypothetical protein
MHYMVYIFCKVASFNLMIDGILYLKTGVKYPRVIPYINHPLKIEVNKYEALLLWT